MKFNNEQIRDYWRTQALDHKEDPRASWTDVNAINLEIEAMSQRLQDGQRVIDIGCANGYSTLNYAQRFALDIKGIDFIPEMIAAATRCLAEARPHLKSEVRFDVGDICALDEPDGAYDTAIVTRVVINLGSRERQIAAIREAARVVRPGGLLLLSEATRDGLERLNAFRAEWKLGPIPEPAFNLYIDEALARAAAPDMLHLEEVSHFASTYFVGTRVLKPLLAQALDNGVDPAAADMNWNRFFSQLPAAGDYGTQKLFVFRRKPA